MEFDYSPDMNVIAPPIGQILNNFLIYGQKEMYDCLSSHALCFLSTEKKNTL